MTQSIEPVSGETIEEMLAGLEKLEHGPWLVTPTNDASGLAQIDNGTDAMWPIIAEWHEAAHVARCDPDTMRSILTELQSLRTLSAAHGEAVAWRIAGGMLTNIREVADRYASDGVEVRPLYLSPDRLPLGVKPVDWVKIARIAYWRRLGLIDAGRQALSEHPL